MYSGDLMLKSILLFVLLGITLVIIVGVLFVNFAPQFGATFDAQHKIQMQSSSQYNQDHFVNTQSTQTGSSNPDGLWGTLIDYIKGTPNQKPTDNIEVKQLSSGQLEELNSPALTWFGHSSFLLSINNQNIFFDPVFSSVPAPHPWLGSKRYNAQHPIEPEDLPTIDAVVISHDHYDHLDYDSVLRMDAKVKKYLVPLGVGQHLIEWGVDQNKITEFDWWQDTQLANVQLTFTPARHFSGRRITNQNQTLWGGWYVKAADFSMFYSGDTGYGSHFTDIANKLGAPDLALLECGQYNEAWADIHMMPEETVLAAQDLQAKVMMPVHWGAFTLSLHSWTDPIERAITAAEKNDQQIVAPEIGEVMVLNETSTTLNKWWSL